jgi:putative oxidoreductase
MFRLVDSIAERGEALWLLIGRIGIGVLFAPSGYGKLTGPGLTGMLTAKGLPAPDVLNMVAGAIELLGGIALIIGLKTRLVAGILIVFTIIATLLAHQYWMFTDPAIYNAQRINFYKNLAIIGGILYVFVRGAGPLSVDRR